MKKIILLFLAFSLVFTGIMPVYSLESGVASFSITPIEADQKHKYIKINITAPETKANSKLLVGFFSDGILTKLTPLNISSKTTFTNQQINTYVLIKDSAGNYYKDLTPDEIKIFTWNQNTLAPKTLCDNVLTPEVIKAANAEVVESLKIVPEATQHIRDNFLTYQQDVEDGIADSWDEHLFPIMDYIDACATRAIKDAETHLITSLYAQEQYRDELSNIKRLLSEATNREKNKLIDLMDADKLGSKHYDALRNAEKFLDFSLK